MPGVTPSAAHEQARAVVDAGAFRLVAPLESAWQQIQLDLQRLRATWAAESPPVRARRLATIDTKVARLMAAAQDRVKGTLPSVVRSVFDQGGAVTSAWLSRRVSWSDADLDVVDAVAADLQADLLTATTYTRISATSMVKSLTRLAREVPEMRAETERAVRRELTDRGVSAVVYRDGSRHGLDTYARMAARTQLAQAWQLAGLRVMGSYGVEWVELVDGAGCGLTSHLDPAKANGMVLRLEQAEAYPLSHPNCIRTTYPRLDVRTVEDARTASPSTRGVAGGGDDLSLAGERRSDGLLDVRAPVVVSPALARHVQMLTGGLPVQRVGRVGRVGRVAGPSGA
jgi:hypothetical protein